MRPVATAARLGRATVLPPRRQAQGATAYAPLLWRTGRAAVPPPRLRRAGKGERRPEAGRGMHELVVVAPPTVVDDLTLPRLDARGNRK